MSMRVTLACLLLVLSGCVGTGATLNTRAAPPPTYNDLFVGMTRAAVIVQYGAPDRTTRLTNDIRLMEYNARSKAIYKTGQRATTDCTLRLWYLAEKGVNDPVIAKTDYLGDQLTCDRFVHGGPKNQTYDLLHR